LALERSPARNADEYSLSKKELFRKPWRKEQLSSKKTFRKSRLSAKASFECVSAGCRRESTDVKLFGSWMLLLIVDFAVNELCILRIDD
jgi:hypothetical protein